MEKRKRSFRILCGIVRAFTPGMKTEWTVPFDGEPCVFVGNHAGAYGPIDMCASFGERGRCWYWLNHDVLDAKLVPAYVRQDYWWKPGCRLEPLFNVTLPYLAALVLPPIVRTAPGVPVYHDMRVMKTMRQSLRLLEEGECLVIFPEQPSGWKSHHTWINTGFLQIAPMYHQRTGKAIKFWPVHLDHAGRRMLVGEPIAFDPARTLAEQTQEIADRLAAGLRGDAPRASAEGEPIA